MPPLHLLIPVFSYYWRWDCLWYALGFHYFFKVSQYNITYIVKYYIVLYWITNRYIVFGISYHWLSILLDILIHYIMICITLLIYGEQLDHYHEFLYIYLFYILLLLLILCVLLTLMSVSNMMLRLRIPAWFWAFPVLLYSSVPCWSCPCGVVDTWQLLCFEPWPHPLYGSVPCLHCSCGVVYTWQLPSGLDDSHSCVWPGFLILC